jgi:hypothetical protein
MKIAPRTAIGRAENSGARMKRVARTRAPVISDASGVPAPDDSFRELAERLVETGMPWSTPAPTFAIPCVEANINRRGSGLEIRIATQGSSAGKTAAPDPRMITFTTS